MEEKKNLISEGPKPESPKIEWRYYTNNPYLLAPSPYLIGEGKNYVVDNLLDRIEIVDTDPNTGVILFRSTYKVKEYISKLYVISKQRLTTALLATACIRIIDGDAYIGISWKSYEDQNNRKKGIALARRRSLLAFRRYKHAAVGNDRFTIEPEMQGFNKIMSDTFGQTFRMEVLEFAKNVQCTIKSGKQFSNPNLQQREEIRKKVDGERKDVYIEFTNQGEIPKLIKKKKDQKKLLKKIQERYKL